MSRSGWTWFAAFFTPANNPATGPFERIKISQSPPYGMHPDQHAAVFAPGHPDIGFFGSDGGLVRTSGTFADHSADCATRGLTGANLTDCQAWLKAIPVQIFTLNDGLRTLQFQGVSFNPNDPRNDLIGGTQDNGTWAYDGTTGNWFESIFGDGGNSGISLGATANRMHTYTGAQVDVNFEHDNPLTWDWVADPLLASGGRQRLFTCRSLRTRRSPEAGSSGCSTCSARRMTAARRPISMCTAMSSSGISRCPAVTGVALGGPAGPGKAGDLVGSGYGTDKSGSYVVWISRALQNPSTMWAATRRGRLFVTKKNADASDPTAVVFKRIDTASQPTRFISAVAIDPENSNHAFVSFSGYNAYTPTTPGHVFDVRYHPGSGTATWTDLSFNLGDMPVTGIALDSVTGTLYVATDFGVASLGSGSHEWRTAAPGLPFVAVYGISIDSAARVL